MISHRFRIALYFAMNLDEELTAADIVVKCNAEGKNSRTNMNEVLAGMVGDGLLARRRNGGRGGPYVYRPGLELRKLVGSLESTRREAGR